MATERSARARRTAAPSSPSSAGSKRRRAQPSQPSAAASSGAQSTRTPPTSPLQDLAAVAASAMQAPVHVDPDRLLALQNEYSARLQNLWTEMLTMTPGTAPALPDKRFSAPGWQQSVPLAWNAALYLLNSEFLQKLADAVDADAKSQERIRFFTRQWLDMVSPANFLPTNPDAQQRLIDSRGESLRKGIDNMLADLSKGHISITDESAFEVGRNVGTSKGAVVFRNDVMELIQYTPTTTTVGSRPLLLVPPFINKFYILDLQPDNSFVAHAVSRGHTVFLVSWINAQREHDRMTWDDYIEQGVIAPASSTHRRAHETKARVGCRILLEKGKLPRLTKGRHCDRCSRSCSANPQERQRA